MTIRSRIDRLAGELRDEHRIETLMAALGCDRDEAAEAVAQAEAALRPYGERVNDGVMVRVIGELTGCDPAEAESRLAESRERLRAVAGD